MEEFYITDDLYATTGQRFVNLIIDRIITYALLFIVGILSALIGELTGIYSITTWMENISSFEDILITTLFLLFYYCVTEVFLGRTIAKYLTKTMVVMEDGSRPDSQTMLKRSLCRLIPFDPLTFLSSPCRGWHDSISDTYVVQKKAFEESRRLFYDFKEIGKENQE